MPSRGDYFKSQGLLSDCKQGFLAVERPQVQQTVRNTIMEPFRN
jgi:hypothetical protein